MNSVLKTLKTSSQALLVCCFLALSAQAQTSPQPEYLLLGTVKATSLERELNESAKQGFRLEKASQMMTTSISVIVSRDPNVTAPRYEYKVIGLDRIAKEIQQEAKKKDAAQSAGDEHNAEWLRRELSGQGWVFRTIMNSSIRFFTVTAPLLVFERELGVTTGAIEYGLIAADSERKLQTLLDNAGSSGFAPVGMPGLTHAGVIVVLQRDTTRPGAEMNRREYRLLDTARAATMEKEINQAAQQGFRFHLSSNDLAMLTARDYKPKEPKKYEYKLIAVQRPETAEKELNELTGQGWTFRATSISYSFTVIMEREIGSPPKAPRIEYKVLATMRSETMQQEINAAIPSGWRLLETTWQVTILARETR
jgi:hypothetical protein